MRDRKGELYGLKYASQPLSGTIYIYTFCAYMNNLNTTGCIQTLMLYYQRCPIPVIELDARYDWQFVSKNASPCLSDNPFVWTYMHA